MSIPMTSSGSFWPEGFGSYVDLEKAMTIGLLPEMDP